MIYIESVITLFVEIRERLVLCLSFCMSVCHLYYRYSHICVCIFHRALIGNIPAYNRLPLFLSRGFSFFSDLHNVSLAHFFTSGQLIMCTFTEKGALQIIGSFYLHLLAAVLWSILTKNTIQAFGSALSFSFFVRKLHILIVVYTHIYVCAYLYWT